LLVTVLLHDGLYVVATCYQPSERSASATAASVQPAYPSR